MPSNISFSAKALAIIADDKIRTAYSRGKFDNLPGFGKPSAVIDEPYGRKPAAQKAAEAGRRCK